MIDTNPKTQYGLAKPSLTYVPPVALFEVGRVMEIGAAKYGPMNWRKDPVSYSTYVTCYRRGMAKTSTAKPSLSILLTRQPIC
jgi:hypothetical protein